jgi:NAD dependent epimerase/dehydratase family enzyme
LNRPTVFPLPAPLARMVLGDFADEMLLASIRVDSTKLRESGYEFRYPELEGALRHLLGR